MNFIIHPDHTKHYEALVGIIVSFDKKGETIVAGNRNVIKKFKIGERTYNVKKFKNPNAFQSLVYRFFRKSKAKRSFEYAQLLLAKNINTPAPICYVENFKVGLRASYYISEQLEYDFDFRELIHNPKYAKREEILRQFTDFSFKMHNAGVNFLDHSPGNTLIKDAGNGMYAFYLIDLNRMRFESMDFDMRMKNLRRLWLSKRMIQIMSKEYARLYEKTYEETHALMTLHSRAFQKKVNSKKIRRRRSS